MQAPDSYLVSVVIPVHNAAKFLDEALSSVAQQTWRESLEVSVFDDASTDDSYNILLSWQHRFQADNIGFVLGRNTSGKPGGVGFGKNRAIQQSHGQFICFLDADDVMVATRIELQLRAATGRDNCIVGTGYRRIPEGSMQRYTEWSNSLTKEQLNKQVYTSHGPTVINPTWFMAWKWFDHLGGFREVAKGYPEDLEFFFRHLDAGGEVLKVDEVLLVYRYHTESATFGVHKDIIWNIRVAQLQKNILSQWSSFTIWNAGKQGRTLFRSLDEEHRKKVVGLCDVDEKKISKGVYTCEMIRDKDTGKPLTLPIMHFSSAQPPFVICVKLDLTQGSFEKNLSSLNLVEGVDYVHFS